MSSPTYNHLDRLLGIVKKRIGQRWRGCMIKPRYKKRVKDCSGFYAVGKVDNAFNPRIVLVHDNYALHYYIRSRDVVYLNLATQQAPTTREIPDAVWSGWRAELHRICDAEYEKRQQLLSRNTADK